MKPKLLFIISLILCLMFSVKSYSQLTGTVVSISGTVKNALTKEPLTVYVIAYTEDGKKVNAARSNASDNGYYFLTGLKPGAKYKIVIEQPRYLKETYELYVPYTTKYTEYSKDFALIPFSQGTAIPLPVPPFELKKTKLRFGIESFLEPFVREFVSNKNATFEIICYPDASGEPTENLKLTEERAKSLMSYFISKGVEPERIKIKGNSSTDPQNPPPVEKRAKGKRYIGTTYIKILNS
jgi:outer membrane protein OmpA-like peptidoglycan-associated protein